MIDKLKDTIDERLKEIPFTRKYRLLAKFQYCKIVTINVIWTSLIGREI